eukprot:7331433-Prymnesium_polylepis.1
MPRHFEATGGAHADLVILNHGTCDGKLGDEAGENVRRSMEQLLPRLREAVGPLTFICLCVPFGGFGGELNEPKGAIKAGFEHYMQHARDSRCLYISFGTDEARNLTGYNFDKMGRFAPTAESYDGLHPLAARHAELGRRVVAKLATLLSLDMHVHVRSTQDPSAACDAAAPLESTSMPGALEMPDGHDSRAHTSAALNAVIEHPRDTAHVSADPGSISDNVEADDYWALV